MDLCLLVVGMRERGLEEGFTHMGLIMGGNLRMGCWSSPEKWVLLEEEETSKGPNTFFFLFSSIIF